MLKAYQTPDLQINILQAADVVTASGVGLQWKSEWSDELFGQ